MSLPFWEEKCWGKVLHCFANDHAAVSYLEVNEGWQCSEHLHRERANTFVVVSGKILVCEFNDVGHKTSSRILLPKDSLTIASGVVHQFKVLKSGQVIEVYYPDSGGKVELDDIERLTVGGRISEL